MAKAERAARKSQPRFPAQHQRRPELESKMPPAPKVEALDGRGSGKLDERVTLITGGDCGIGRAVAVWLAHEGADVAIVYLPADRRDVEVTESAVVAEGAAICSSP
jgi:hypothetical protein